MAAFNYKELRRRSSFGFKIYEELSLKSWNVCESVDKTIKKKERIFRIRIPKQILKIYYRGIIKSKVEKNILKYY